MSTLPYKRPRTSDGSPVDGSTAEKLSLDCPATGTSCKAQRRKALSSLLGDAPTSDVRSLLLDAAVQHPDVGEQLAVYAKAHAPDAVGIVGVSALPGKNFDRYVPPPCVTDARYAVAARTVLGLLYESKRENYDDVAPALLDIEANLDDMVERVQTGEYRLILSALESMCRIFVAVCSLGEGKLGNEVRRIVVKNGWGAKISEVVEQFSDDDYVRLAAEDNGWWIDKHFAPAVHCAETFGLFDEVVHAYEELLGRSGLDSDESESEGVGDAEAEDEGEGAQDIAIEVEAELEGGKPCS